MNTVKGLLGIAGIWLTMSLMPLTEWLQLSPYEATVLRGASGVIVVAVMACFGRVTLAWPDRYTRVLVSYYVVATICLFQAIVAWGANRSALFLDLAVLVPVAFAWCRRQVVGSAVYTALALAVLGTVLALRAWQGAVVWTGLGFSLVALFANGLFIQYADKAKQGDWLKAFWMSVGLVAAGLGGAAMSDTTLELGEGFARGHNELKWLVLLVLFSVGTGVFNFYCFFVASSNLKAVEVGVLVLGVTPSIMLASYLIMGVTMKADQYFGVGLTLIASFLFGNSLRTKT